MTRLIQSLQCSHSVQERYKLMYLTAPAVEKMEDDIRMLRELIALRKETIAEKEAQIGCSNPAIFRTLQVCRSRENNSFVTPDDISQARVSCKSAVSVLSEDEARSTERRQAVHKCEPDVAQSCCLACRTARRPRWRLCGNL